MNPSLLALLVVLALWYLAAYLVARVVAAPYRVAAEVVVALVAIVAILLIFWPLR